MSNTDSQSVENIPSLIIERYMKLYEYTTIFFRHNHRAVYYCVLIGIFIGLLANRGYYYVPNSDYWNYLSVGKSFIEYGRLSQISPLLYSSGIYLAEKFIPLQHAGVHVGVFFSILFHILSSFLLWKLLYGVLGAWSYVPSILFLSNYVTISESLQPTNMTVFTFVTLLSLVAYNRKRPNAPILISLFSLGLRYEGVIFLCIYVTLWLKAKGVPRLKLPVILTVITSATFIAVLIFPSLRFYQNELSRYIQYIPNYQYLIDNYVNYPFGFTEITVGWDTLIWLGILLHAGFKIANTHGGAMRVILIFVIIYTCIHTAFPSDQTRYSYPTLWVIYFYFTYALLQVTRGIRIKPLYFFTLTCVTTLMLFMNIRYVMQELPKYKYIKAENRLAGEWLTDNVNARTSVITLEPWITEYYTHNDFVTFEDIYSSESIQKLEKTLKKTEIIIIRDTQTDNNAYNYFSILHNRNFFEEFGSTTDSQYALTETLSIGNRFASIYKKRVL